MEYEVRQSKRGRYRWYLTCDGKCVAQSSTSYKSKDEAEESYQCVKKYCCESLQNRYDILQSISECLYENAKQQENDKHIAIVFSILIGIAGVIITYAIMVNWYERVFVPFL